MKLAILGVLIIPLLHCKTLFLNERDLGSLYVNSNFITTLTFSNAVKTLFLGDTISFRAEISENRKVVALWVSGKQKQTNLLILTDKEQFNFNIKQGQSRPPFYFIKKKEAITKGEIISRSERKDKDIIQSYKKIKSLSKIRLAFYDKEYFKDSIYVNVRVKVLGDMKNYFIKEIDTIISQNGKILPVIYAKYNNSTQILSITGKERNLRSKFLLQLPIYEKKDKKRWVNQIIF